MRKSGLPPVGDENTEIFILGRTVVAFPTGEERSHRYDPNSRPPHPPRLYEPWHFLYFLPEPHGHGSFLPTFPTRDQRESGDTT